MNQPMTLEQHTDMLLKAFAHLETTLHQDAIMLMAGIVLLLVVAIICAVQTVKP